MQAFVSVLLVLLLVPITVIVWIIMFEMARNLWAWFKDR